MLQLWYYLTLVIPGVELLKNEVCEETLEEQRQVWDKTGGAGISWKTGRSSVGLQKCQQGRFQLQDKQMWTICHQFKDKEW